MARVFISPSKYVQGPGELARLGDYTKAYGAHALVVISAGGLRRFGDVITASLDAAGVDADALETFMQESPYGAYYLDATGYGSANVVLLDDATWCALAESLGLSDDEKDPATLSCVVLNAADVTNSDTYGTVRPFTGSSGTIELYADPERMASDQWLGPADDGTFGLVTTDEDPASEGDFASHLYLIEAAE